MPKKVVSVSVDESLIPAIDRDRGRGSFSAHINYILEILYSSDFPLSRELEALRKNEGLRDIPEVVKVILTEGVDKKLKHKGLK